MASDKNCFVEYNQSVLHELHAGFVSSLARSTKSASSEHCLISFNGRLHHKIVVPIKTFPVGDNRRVSKLLTIKCNDVEGKGIYAARKKRDAAGEFFAMKGEFLGIYRGPIISPEFTRANMPPDDGTHFLTIPFCCKRVVDGKGLPFDKQVNDATVGSFINSGCGRHADGTSVDNCVFRFEHDRYDNPDLRYVMYEPGARVRSKSKIVWCLFFASRDIRWGEQLRIDYKADPYYSSAGDTPPDFDNSDTEPDCSE
jgi:hypothetical protein